MAREYTGNIDFTYDIEAATAGYGQGITTTPIQHIQALTMIANNGTMIKPYIVSKIVNPNTDKTIYNASIKKEENIVSTETVDKMKELLRSVVQPEKENATGYAYYMEDYDLTGKIY